MRTRERLSKRLITGHAQSRLERLSLPDNPTISLDAYRNLQVDLLPYGRVTGTTPGSLDGYAVISDATYPVKKSADSERRMQSAYLGGPRLGYALDPPAENRIYQTDLMRTSGQIVNWVANAAAFYGVGTLDPINLNNGGFSSQTASYVVALSANATVIQSGSTAFAGGKLFSIWVKSLTDASVPFDIQVTSGVWVRKTATAQWQRFSHRIPSGAALPGIRVPNGGDGLILWGPQLMASSNASIISPRRLTLGPAPVINNVKNDVLRFKTQNKNTGTFVVDVVLNPLTNGYDACQFQLSNFDYYLTGGNGNWTVDLYQSDSEVDGGIAIYGDFPDYISVIPYSAPNKRMRLVVRITDSLIAMYVNGTPAAETSFDNIVTPLNLYLNGLHNHVVSFQAWPEVFSDSKCIELSRYS